MTSFLKCPLYWSISSTGSYSAPSSGPHEWVSVTQPHSGSGRGPEILPCGKQGQPLPSWLAFVLQVYCSSQTLCPSDFKFTGFPWSSQIPPYRQALTDSSLQTQPPINRTFCCSVFSGPEMWMTRAHHHQIQQRASSLIRKDWYLQGHSFSFWILLRF